MKLSESLRDLAYQIQWAETKDLQRLQDQLETLTNLCLELAEAVEQLQEKQRQ